MNKKWIIGIIVVLIISIVAIIIIDMSSIGIM